MAFLGFSRFSKGALLVLAASILSSTGKAATSQKIERVKFNAQQGYLTIEVLTDRLVHFELSSKLPGPGTGAPIATSPMVVSTQYPGPSRFRQDGNKLETDALRLEVDPTSLCVQLQDKRTGEEFTRICPRNLNQDWKGFTFTPSATQNLYGLGQQFRQPGVQNGDWVGDVRHPGDGFGNQMVPFNGGKNGNTQIPVLYALGKDQQNYALFVDDVLKQNWDFTASPWRVETWSEPLRWYFIAGPSLAETRKVYMDLVGHPLVPPRKMFGMWVSEYGYRNWDEMERVLSGLRSHHFPVDGFVLDLFWFGGITPKSFMGKVDWDLDRFPDPKNKIASLREKDGIGLITIEESYISRGLPEHAELAKRGYLVSDQTGEPALLGHPHGWWGEGGMLDWTNKDGAAYWQHSKRAPLIDAGVLGHWTDLGEPEMYAPDAIYWNGKRERDVHNLYNFRWLESIFQGYSNDYPEKRPFILSRSGTAGIQRFGTAMWSGDIGSDLKNLAASHNAQMHMSLSGIDYYGSDIGGFIREALTGDLNEMYTQWFASGTLFDVPARPHTNNLCQCRHTSPDSVGDAKSNLQNLRQRYALIPYVYSLAHMAYLEGEAVFPPPLYYFPSDQNLRQLGNEKMIGPSLLAPAIAGAGQTKASVYLPLGKWIEFHSNQWFTSRGQTFGDLALFTADKKFQVPLFARAGALIPMMYVDDKTMNSLGRRTDGSVRNELIVKVYGDSHPSSFTLYEDDGETSHYQGGDVRKTKLAQEESDREETIIIAAADGSYDGAVSHRNNILDLVLDKTNVDEVRLNGGVLPRIGSLSQWTGQSAGWFADGSGRVLVKSGDQPVSVEKNFVLTLRK